MHQDDTQEITLGIVFHYLKSLDEALRAHMEGEENKLLEVKQGLAELNTEVNKIFRRLKSKAEAIRQC